MVVAKMPKNLLKNLTYKKSGDKLEVKVRDNFFNIIYKREVNVKDNHQLSGLVNDLNNLGIKLPLIREIDDTGWF